MLRRGIIATRTLYRILPNRIMLSDSILSLLNDAVYHLDEPFYSSVSVSTYSLAKQASKYVKGVMTGDGSDELLFGYEYLRSALTSSSEYEKYLSGIGWLKYESPSEWLTSYSLSQDEIKHILFSDCEVSGNIPETLRRVELYKRLPDYHMMRVDKLTMACGLEARVPYLRNDYADFMLSIDSCVFLKEKDTKSVLKKSFRNLLPRELLCTIKKPFTAPIKQWLEHELKEDVCRLINGKWLLQQLPLNCSKITQLLTNYRGTYADVSNLWGIYLLAWAVQNILEKSIIELINWAIQATGITNVCAAGGVFMNCKMNMVVRENSLAKNYFVQPLAGDAGLVIGAGLLATKSNFKGSFSGLNLGPEYSDEEIEAVLCAAGVKYRKADDLAYEVAQFIAQGKIVGWFEGRMEMGARALGSRSILADPRDPNMSDRINYLIKHREKWRPFACSVLEDFCDDIFENYDCEKAFPFMIEAFKVKEAWVKKIPAVVHRADGTSRPQTVNKNVKPLYYGMINHFKDITGCPLVLNTSFNDKGQPIVMSPELAVDFHKRIPIDVLAIGSFLVERSEH